MSSIDIIDINVLAERFAEVVNRKLKIFDQRMSEYESRLKKLELDVDIIRRQTIESIIKSVLTVKSEELAAAVAVKVSSEFSKSIEDVVRVAEEFRDAADAIRNTVEGLSKLSNELKALPEKVVEALKSVKPSVQIDTSGIEIIVSRIMSRSMRSVEELTARVGALEKTMNEVSTSLRSLVKSLALLPTVISRIEDIEKVKENVDYLREMFTVLIEELRGTLKGRKER